MLEFFLRENSQESWFKRENKIIGIIFTLIMPLRFKDYSFFGSSFASIFVPVGSENDTNYNIFVDIANIINKKELSK
jgi:hypothetical protein